jgi:hypothetical protein
MAAATFSVSLLSLHSRGGWRLTALWQGTLIHCVALYTTPSYFAIADPTLKMQKDIMLTSAGILVVTYHDHAALHHQ